MTIDIEISLPEFDKGTSGVLYLQRVAVDVDNRPLGLSRHYTVILFRGLESVLYLGHLPMIPIPCQQRKITPAGIQFHADEIRSAT